jgi:hypothetical protein
MQPFLNVLHHTVHTIVIKKGNMKCSSSLLQAIAVSVTVATLGTTTSCEKEPLKKMKKEINDDRNQPDNTPHQGDCAACGMG